MTQELIYTSAPKGLKLGSRGFCTVASTPGMAKPLADRLEALSGYRHLFQPGSSEAAKNPVNYSFVTFKLGGKTHYVLSRVGDAGLDHTQRSNKIAHHVVLDSRELVSAGPAWLLSQPGFVANAWDGEPRLLPATKMMPQGDLPVAPCHSWKQAAGDAGWAGVLAETVEDGTHPIAYVIFPNGTDVLKLVAEAQALLSPSKRWGATFSTYWCKLPPGVECRWRFIPDNSQECVLARRTPQALLLDISKPLGKATDSAFAEFARTGSAASTTSTRPRESTSASRLVENIVIPHEPLSEGITEASASAPAPPQLPTKRTPNSITLEAGERDAARTTALWTIVPTTAIVLAILVVGIFLWSAANRNKQGIEKTAQGTGSTTIPVPEESIAPPQPSESVSRAADDGGEAHDTSSIDGDNAPHPGAVPAGPNSPEESGLNVEETAATVSEIDDGPSAPATEVLPDPVVVDGELQVALPPLPRASIARSVENTATIATITGDWDALGSMRIQMLDRSTEDSSVRLREDSKPGTWVVVTADGKLLASVVLSKEPDSDKSLLSFSWNSKTALPTDEVNTVSWGGMQIEIQQNRHLVAFVPDSHKNLPIRVAEGNPSHEHYFEEINQLLAKLPKHQNIEVEWTICNPENLRDRPKLETPLPANGPATVVPPAVVLLEGLPDDEEAPDVLATFELQPASHQRLQFAAGIPRTSSSGIGPLVEWDSAADQSRLVRDVLHKRLSAFSQKYREFMWQAWRIDFPASNSKYRPLERAFHDLEPLGTHNGTSNREDAAKAGAFNSEREDLKAILSYKLSLDDLDDTLSKHLEIRLSITRILDAQGAAKFRVPLVQADPE